MTTKELREKIKSLAAQARGLMDNARNEKREMRADESDQFDKIMAEIDGLKQRISQLEALADADEAAEGDDESDREGDGEGDGEGDESDDEEDEEGERNRQREGGERRGGRPRPGGERRAVTDRRNSPEYRAAVARYLLTGRLDARAVQADVDISGGFLVMPQEFVGQLIKFVDNLVWIRQLATKFVLSAAQSLGAPSLDTDVSDSDWTSELATGNEDSSLAFGKRELTPHPLAKRLKVSNKLLRAAANKGVFSATPGSLSGIEALVRDRLGYKFGVTEEQAFLTGSGSQQPLGVFTASTRGISTGRDVQTGSATTFTADQLIVSKFTLKPQYHSSARWLFHRDGYSKIRQLKDSHGQYLWLRELQPGLGASDPDRLLDMPVMLSEYCPNTFTTGQYVGLLGDFSFYWIADAETLMIQRLNELYAETNQTGFIARMDLDGMPVLEEAFVRLITN